MFGWTKKHWTEIVFVIFGVALILLVFFLTVHQLNEQMLSCVNCTTAIVADLSNDECRFFIKYSSWYGVNILIAFIVVVFWIINKIDSHDK